MATVLKVKSGGSWRTITAPEVKLSGSWRDIKGIEVKEGGSWRTVFLAGPEVSPSGANVTKSVFTDVTCYARIRYATSGIEYQTNLASSSGTPTSRGNWLDFGLNSEVWVQRVINTGSLSLDPGSGRLQLSTERIFGVQRNGQGNKTCNLTFNFYDAASGGSLIGSATLSLSATADYL